MYTCISIYLSQRHYESKKTTKTNKQYILFFISFNIVINPDIEINFVIEKKSIKYDLKKGYVQVSPLINIQRSQDELLVMESQPISPVLYARKMIAEHCNLTIRQTNVNLNIGYTFPQVNAKINIHWVSKKPKQAKIRYKVILLSPQF